MSEHVNDIKFFGIAMNLIERGFFDQAVEDGRLEPFDVPEAFCWVKFQFEDCLRKWAEQSLQRRSGK